jgi:hypothetical protein
MSNKKLIFEYEKLQLSRKICTLLLAFSKKSLPQTNDLNSHIFYSYIPNIAKKIREIITS